MYLNQYYKREKRGWFAKLGQRKILKKDIAKLLAHATDEKLIETVRYIYNLNDGVAYSDLNMIRVEMFKTLEKHYDQVIKNLGVELSSDKVSKIENDFKLLKNLIKEYEPKEQKN